MENEKGKEKIISAMDDKLCPPSAVPGPLLPWFIYTHSDSKSKNVQTFSTAPFNGKSYLRSVPEMRGKYVEASLLGWLLIRDYRVVYRDYYSYTLWNPFTFESIHLPPLSFHDEGAARKRCALTSPPYSNEDDCCFVFLFFQGWAFSCRLPPKRKDVPRAKWVSRRIEVQGQIATITQVVTLNGVLYGIAFTMDPQIRSMVCIEVASDRSNSFTLRSLPFISMPPYFFLALLDACYTFMVESCGSIYLVQVGTRHYDSVHVVRVLELDLQKGMWAEVKCLGDRAFLLAEDGCSWCWASDKSTGTVNGDCIYVFRPEYEQEGVVCFRLNDFSCTLLPCPKLLHPRTDWPVWVTPQRSRFSGIRQCEKTMDKNDDVIKSYEAVSTTECMSLPQHDNLYKLPEHIIQLLSTYMHLFDYWNFRCACKIIKSATSIPQWRTNNSLPLFIVFEDDGGLCRVMDPCRDDSHSCFLQISQDFFDIEFSKNGWLLIRDSKSLMFFNPFTRERLYLPPATGRYLTIGFSSYPTCSACLILAINLNHQGIFINYLRFGDKEWSSCQFEHNHDYEFNPGFCSPMYFSSGFYILDLDTGNLGVFELKDGGEAQWTIYDRPFVRAGSLHSSYLVECGGELISVFIGKHASWLQLFKFNNPKKKWVRVKDLGNHTLFISHVSCFSEVTQMKNRIYLPWLIGKRLVFYSLETQRYHVDGNENSYKDLFFMMQPLRCCWI